jgi:hypothetical protein
MAARDRVIAELRARPGPSCEERRFLAEFDGKSDPDKAADAIARLEAMLADPTLDGSTRDLTLAAIVEIAGVHLPDIVPDFGVKPAPERHRELLRRWQQRASGIRSPLAKATADTWIARSLCCSGVPGDLARGLDLLRATCEAFPDRAGAALAYCQAASVLTEQAPGWVRAGHMLAASQAAAVVLHRVASGELAVIASTLDRLHFFAWSAAATSGNVLEMKRLLPLVESDLDEPTLERAHTLLRTVEEQFEAFRGGKRGK